MTECPCPDCHGARLKPEILSVTVGGKNIKQVCDMQVVDSLKFFYGIDLSKRDRKIADPIIKEIHSRLNFPCKRRS